MAALSLKDNLQPSLLDRLVDEERVVTRYRITVDRNRLESLGITPRDLEEILVAQGLRRETDQRERAASPGAREYQFEMIAYGLAIGPGHLRTIRLTPPAAPEGVQLQEFCQFESRTSINTESEAAVRSTVSMRRLRESVQRDLGWLLNAQNLGSTIDLDLFPEVRRSVLNYGLPSFAGRAASSIDARGAAAELARAIEFFEPRLSRVKVTPEESADSGDEFTVRFRIDAELWGRPAAQHLTLLTSIDVGSGDVSVNDVDAR
jgi:type VI secretion system protein ImpF